LPMRLTVVSKPAISSSSQVASRSCWVMPPLNALPGPPA
jgi:hypothetical protein